jgi:hypothetical protein
MPEFLAEDSNTSARHREGLKAGLATRRQSSSLSGQRLSARADRNALEKGQQPDPTMGAAQ